MTKNKAVPTFGADGRRLRDYSADAIERLLALDKIVVRRNAKGRILCAQVRPLTGANPLRGSVHMGTYYSYEEHIADGYVWTHRRLPQSQEVFAAVPISITHNAHAKEKSSTRPRIGA